MAPRPVIPGPAPRTLTPNPECSMVVRHPHVPDVPTLFNRMAFLHEKLGQVEQTLV